ncbi:MAG: S8 family peptidase [Lachnospiraceae bacterium]|nr:S8 family peptidase [Lachnospiraceae bacterium]
MDDQKIENLLNLALDASLQEREKSSALETGYDEESDTWEVIVRFTGDIKDLIHDTWQVAELSGGYAIVTLPQRDMERLAALPQTEYIEKPKRLYFEADTGRAASCISPLQTPQYGLFGEGVLVAVIDSGIDYFHPDFRNEDGSTRILALWDQTAVPQSTVGEPGGNMPERELADRQNNSVRRETPPEGFVLGIEYTKEDIDEALRTGSREDAYAIVPERDLSGHGTQVAGIAAGNGRASGGRYRGVAARSDLIVVKLGVPREGGFPRTTELMQALEYVIRKSEKYRRPIAVNLSFGNAYGSHRGTSLLEEYIDLLADRGRNVIAVGTGNEGNTGGHVAGQLSQQPREIEFVISDFETVMNLQIWKNYADSFRITIIHPNGSRVDLIRTESEAYRYRLGNVTLLVYYGAPSPYQIRQEIFVDFIPDGTYLDSGIWRVLLTPERIVTGDYELWMPDSRARSSGSRFLQPSPETTMTVPSAAHRVVAVGAYDARQNAYASFSGRGWPDAVYQVRPDLAAPGVAITTTAAGGGYISVTGTSFATPFVTGAAAMMMQWGIVQGNDPYLYGEKVRAYLQRGARQLPGFTQWPNNQVGYGALCVRDSLPM